MQVVLNYMLDMSSSTEEPFQQCVPGFAYDSVANAYSAKFCWRDACLPDRFSGNPFAAFTSVRCYCAWLFVRATCTLLADALEMPADSLS